MWELLGRIVFAILGVTSLIACSFEFGAAWHSRKKGERRTEIGLWIGGTLTLVAACAFFVVAVNPSSDAVFLLPASYLAHTANKRLCQRSVHAASAQTGT